MQHFHSQGLEPLSAREARQFLRHATRVRSLHIITDIYFHLLALLPIETCVFPRLLELFFSHHMNLECLPLFLSPTLRRCGLQLHPLLKSIGTRCADLEALSVLPPRGGQTADDLTSLSDVIHSCKRLVKLRCSPLDSVTWTYLSNLHTLVSVEIFGVCRPLDQDNLKFASFLNVTTLSFGVDKATDMITLLQHSKFPSLKDFQFRSVEVMYRAEVEQLFRALSQCGACHTLERIKFASAGSEIEDGSTSAMMKHLFCFTELRTLSVNGRRSIYLTDDLLLEAASNWPHIRCLELGAVHPLDTPTITFRGLFAALRRCPHLHTLQLTMDAVNIDIDPASESFQHTSLKTLHVCCSHVAHAEVVARIIFSMLPCVDEVNFYRFIEGHGNHPLTSWGVVNSHLESLRSSAVVTAASQE